VLQIDPNTGEVLQTVKLPGAEIRSIAVGEGAVWTLQTGGVYRLDPATAKVTGHAALPAYQVGQLAAGAGAVWATLQLPGGGTALARVDPRTLKVRRIPLPTGQNSGTTTRVTVGRGAVWWEAPDAGAVYRVDPGSDRIVSAVHVTPPIRATADAEPVSLAAGVDAVWVTVTFGP
jgi:streptogramin lyase